MDQFTQMRSMLSSFLWQKQETTTHAAFCNYLHGRWRDEKDFSPTFKARQNNTVISPSSHSNRHFHEAQVQLQQMCQRHFNNHSSQHYLQGNTSLLSQRHRCLQARSSNPLVIDNQQARPSRPLTFTLTQSLHPSIS